MKKGRKRAMEKSYKIFNSVVLKIGNEIALLLQGGGQQIRKLKGERFQRLKFSIEKLIGNDSGVYYYP